VKEGGRKEGAARKCKVLGCAWRRVRGGEKRGRDAPVGSFEAEAGKAEER
jgi:hypothetical protein